MAYWEALIPTVATGCMKPSVWETLECVKCLLKKGVPIISEVFSFLGLFTFFEGILAKSRKIHLLPWLFKGERYSIQLINYFPIDSVIHPLAGVSINFGTSGRVLFWKAFLSRGVRGNAPREILKS